MWSYPCAYAPCYKDIWGGGVNLHAFLILILDGGEWSAACSSHFTLVERVIGYETELPPE